MSVLCCSPQKTLSEVKVCSPREKYGAAYSLPSRLYSTRPVTSPALIQPSGMSRYTGQSWTDSVP